MQNRAKAVAALLLAFLVCNMATWGYAQQKAPACEPMSEKQESISCWLQEADRLLKNKQADAAMSVLNALSKYTTGQPLLEAHRLSQLGNVYWAKTDYDSCYRYEAAAADIYQEIKHLAGAALSFKTMGAVLIKKNELDRATQFFYKAIEAAEQADADSLKTVPYMNLAYVFGQLGDEPKKRAFLFVSHDFAKKSNNSTAITITGMSLAMSYINASMLDSARIFAEQSLRDLQSNSQMRACSYYSLALWEAAKGNWEAANQNYLKMKNDTSISDFHRAGFLQEYANFLKNKKLYHKAQPVFEEVMQQAKRSQQTDLLHFATAAYYPMLEEMKDYKRAYEVAKEYMALHDTIHKQLTEAKIREINVKYETAEKERALQASKLELAEHTNQRNLLLGGLVLLGLLATIIVLRQRYRMKLARKLLEQEAEIARQKVERMQQEQNYLAFKSMVNGEESERTRMAKELHDGLGGLLSSLKLTLTNRRNCRDDETCQEQIKIVDKASSELRRIAQNMMPESLAKFGLIAALEDLCADLESHAHLKAEFQHYGVKEPLPQTMLLPLYRIAQESLNNVVKHSEATEVMLQLIQQGDEMHLTIEDNGVGFQWEKAFENGGSGLKNLHSRVAFLNGKIEFDSTPGEGTAINIDIPVN